MPPCLTSQDTLKDCDITEPHFTKKHWLAYQKSKTRTIKNGTFRSKSFLKRRLWFTRSKALDASKNKYIYRTRFAFIIFNDLFKSIHTHICRVTLLQPKLAICFKRIWYEYDLLCVFFLKYSYVHKKSIADIESFWKLLYLSQMKFVILLTLLWLQIHLIFW